MSKILLWYALYLDKRIEEYKVLKDKYIIYWNNTSKKKYYKMAQKINGWIDKNKKLLDETHKRLTKKERITFGYKAGYIEYPEYLTMLTELEE